MGWEQMEDVQANFLEPAVFKVIWKNDYRGFQMTEKAKVKKTA